VNWQDTLATGHVLAALAALLTGVANLWLPKGTRTHRAIGTIYGLALVTVNLAALSLHRENVFGVFHALAIISLATLVAGLAPLLLGKRSGQVLATHAYCMSWSYAGLAAAGLGQLAVTVDTGWGAWLVPTVIATVLSISAVAILGKVPPTLGRTLTQ
jgi:uncharacterized membrane protein